MVLSNEFEVLAKAEIEHLVGFVEDDGLQLRDIEAASPQMVAQSPGRADHDMRAGRQLALFGAGIHAADAGDDTPIGVLIEPRQFALHLQGKLAGRRDDQGQWCGSPLESFTAIEQVFGDRQPIGDGFAGPGLRRNQQVATGGLVRQYGSLHCGRGIVVALGESPRKRRACSGECHEMADPGLVPRGKCEGAPSPRGSKLACGWQMHSRVGGGLIELGVL